MNLSQELQAQAAINAAFADAIASALGIERLNAADAPLPPDMSLCQLPWELRPGTGAETTGAPGAAALKIPGVWPHVRFRGEWYPVPSMGELEEFVYDSVCFTPDDDEVEPDHPDSWLSIFCLI